ncbi:MAG: dihydrofolate reductase family protein [Aquihabitans sp.]
MQPLRYSINVTLDGCVDHTAGVGTPAVHRHFAGALASASCLLYGRVTYGMMEDAWRKPADGTWPDWMEDWMVPFAEAIDASKKYVVSSTLESVDWNSELVTGDLEAFVRDLKAQDGDGIALGGVTLPLALADLRLIDEYEFVVHPIVAGHGPTLFGGLAEKLELEQVDRHDIGGGTFANRYVPRTS